jgi:hypothetical protein
LPAIKAIKPRPDKSPLPAAPSGYHWRRHGVGFELRQTVVEDGHRRHVYRGHLSQTAMNRMKDSGNFNEELKLWIESKIE